MTDLAVVAQARPAPMSPRELEFHRAAVRSGFITSEYRFVDGRRQIVNWNVARDAFTIEAVSTADGFTLADQISAEKRYEISLHARRITPRGVLFQYLVCGWTSDHGSAA